MRRAALRLCAPRVVLVALAAMGNGVVMVATLTLSGCTTFDGLTATGGQGGGGGDTGGGAPGGGGQGAQGGAGGDGGVPTFDGGYLPVGEALKVCQKAFECPMLGASIAASIGVPVSVDHVSRCAHWLAAPIPSSHTGQPVQRDLLQCIASAASCEEAMSCAFVEVLAPDDDRCAGDPEPACEDGTHLLDCAGLRRWGCSSDLFAAGSTCDVSEMGTPACTLGACSMLPKCLDAVWYVCFEGEQLSYGCATVGQSCASNLACGPAEGEPAASCDVPGAVSCAGPIAQACDGSLLSTFRCDDLEDGQCVQTFNHGRCATGTELCDANSDEGVACTGDALTLCIGGVPATVDCAELGLACIAETDAHTAYCGTP